MGTVVVGLSQKRLKQQRLQCCKCEPLQERRREVSVPCPSVPCLSLKHLVTEAPPPPHTQKQVASPYQPFPWAQGGNPGKTEPSNYPGDPGRPLTSEVEMTMFLCVYRIASSIPRGSFPRADPSLASDAHSASSADDQEEPCHYLGAPIPAS